ncbi:MAG TPA: hypothetical protein VFS52_19640 [Steroidobacteraceae bacterium]|jgi:hypothetical protein|nr:hypothetical protein [Steroidobacteraceae bacterium]
MNRYLPTALALALGIASATAAWAQTPQDQNATPPSSTAETPPASGAEPADASSPHQREATAGSKGAHDKQMMKDCIAREQANNSSTTEAQAKKACKEQMKQMRKDSSEGNKY